MCDWSQKLGLHAVQLLSVVTKNRNTRCTSVVSGHKNMFQKHLDKSLYNCGGKVFPDDPRAFGGAFGGAFGAWPVDRLRNTLLFAEPTTWGIGVIKGIFGASKNIPVLGTNWTWKF